ncbi:hypothetical protein ACHAWO_003143 [Cyclotella atomus]|uniref:Elongator complex protein 4 n=1 Tax=Cyclotella atomus TaxID=382360 RepID=A0ABD3MUY2_9STRA
MSSSFKRRTRSKPPITSQGQSTPSTPNTQPLTSLPGTKPSTTGPITSFGLREIDSFFFSSAASSGGGGGQPLQSLVLVEEDRLADDLGWCLSRYWCGEGVAGGQIVLMGALVDTDLKSMPGLDAACDDSQLVGFDDGCTVEEMEQFKLSLPRNLHLDKFRSRSKENNTNTNEDGGRREPMAIVEEDGEDMDDETNSSKQRTASEEGLVNAWQYRKSVQDARSGMSGPKGSEIGTAGNVYCHSFDLSKSMLDQYSDDETNPLETNVKIVGCTCRNANSKDYRVQGLHLFKTIWNHIQSALASNSQSVIRLFLRRLPIGPGSVALPLLMSKIRQETLPIIILATIRPWRFLTYPNNHGINKLDTLSSLRSTADTIFAADSFSSFQTPPPPEFSLLQGILTVRKCASFTTAYYTDTICFKNRPLAERFGVKRDGRKVTVQLLHLPPEEYSKGGSSTDGVRSGGGQIASSQSSGGCSSAQFTGASSSDW